MRQEGFYWIRFEGHDWEISSWDGDEWWQSGSEMPSSYTPFKIEEIDERRIERA